MLLRDPLHEVIDDVAGDARPRIARDPAGRVNAHSDHSARVRFLPNRAAALPAERVDVVYETRVGDVEHGARVKELELRAITIRGIAGDLRIGPFELRGVEDIDCEVPDFCADNLVVEEDDAVIEIALTLLDPAVDAGKDIRGDCSERFIDAALGRDHANRLGPSTFILKKYAMACRGQNPRRDKPTRADECPTRLRHDPERADLPPRVHGHSFLRHPDAVVGPNDRLEKRGVRVGSGMTEARSRHVEKRFRGADRNFVGDRFRERLTLPPWMAILGQADSRPRSRTGGFGRPIFLPVRVFHRDVSRCRHNRLLLTVSVARAIAEGPTYTHITLTGGQTEHAGRCRRKLPRLTPLSLPNEAGPGCQRTDLHSTADSKGSSGAECSRRSWQRSSSAIAQVGIRLPRRTSVPSKRRSTRAGTKYSSTESVSRPATTGTRSSSIGCTCATSRSYCSLRVR